MFAGSCVGIILLTMSLAGLRRAHRHYDQRILSESQKHTKGQAEELSRSSDPEASGGSLIKGTYQNVRAKALSVGKQSALQGGRPNLGQQIVRSLLHMVEFGVAYFIMLLAMSFNGYVIFSIFVGAFLGYFIFDWQLRST